MFDMSWSEILLIAVVALMVIGPKDLPKMLKVLAQLARKARTLAREFQSGIEDMAREAELHELKKEIDDTVSTDLEVNPPDARSVTPSGIPAELIAICLTWGPALLLVIAGFVFVRRQWRRRPVWMLTLD